MAEMPATLKVTDLPSSERPRERLYQHGAEALSTQELLACVLGRGIPGESVLVTAQRILQAQGGEGGLAAASVEQLTQIRGVGLAKAVQLKAAVVLGRRVDKAQPQPGAALETAEQVARLLAPSLRAATEEHFLAMLLDARHRALRTVEIAHGSLTATIVHPREVFKTAMAANAAAVIVAHNHPSGDPAPSDEDVVLTQRLHDAGALIGIPLLDHLIIGRRTHCSLRATKDWPAHA